MVTLAKLQEQLTNVKAQGRKASDQVAALQGVVAETTGAAKVLEYLIGLELASQARETVGAGNGQEMPAE